VRRPQRRFVHGRRWWAESRRPPISRLARSARPACHLHRSERALADPKPRFPEIVFTPDTSRARRPGRGLPPCGSDRCSSRVAIAGFGEASLTNRLSSFVDSYRLATSGVRRAGKSSSTIAAGPNESRHWRLSRRVDEARLRIRAVRLRMEARPIWASTTAWNGSALLPPVEGGSRDRAARDPGPSAATACSGRRC
jgi:hypothetical protein